MIRDLLSKAAAKSAASLTQMKPAFESPVESLRAAKNFAEVAGYISLYAARASYGKATIRDPHDRLRYFTKTVGRYSKMALDAMNVEVKVVGYDPKLMAENNFLMIGNHMSYVDILVTSSVHPTVFVTSIDMGEVFFLGTMAELGGSIFIERRNRSQIGKDLGVICNTLKAGFDVMVYPEGTSGDGLKILPFKKSLLMSAVQAERDIMPVCLKYTEIDGEPFGPSNCHKVAWFGDMPFAPHFLGVMGLKSVKAELHFLNPIKVTPDSTRHDLAEQARKAIEAVYMSGQQAEALPTESASAPTAIVTEPFVQESLFKDSDAV